MIQKTLGKMDRADWVLRTLSAIAGLAILAIGGAADYVGLGAGAGFGALQTFCIVFGLIVAAGSPFVAR